MADNNTPKKPAKCNTSSSVNDLCRICKCHLKIEFGSGRVSFENLFKASGRKESKGLILSQACEIVGLPVQKSPLLSERICRPCGRKIRNVHENFTFLKDKLDNSESECTKNRSPARQKRQLPTTVTPERQCHRQGRTSCTEKNKYSPRKGLFVDEGNSDHDTDAQVQRVTDDEVHNLMNIETIIPNEKESQVRVLISYPNSRVVVKESFDKLTSSLIKNIALKNWSTVANIVFKHTDIREHLPKVLNREVGAEFRSFSSDSILSGSLPDELAAFSNKIFVHEVNVKCPLWSATMSGACGASPQNCTSSQNRVDRALNAMALATSALARSRNAKLSAYAYRISLILFKSGASYYDRVRLNRLGICMSPESVVNLQKKMGMSTDTKVLSWKKNVEENLKAQNFIKEVETIQTHREEDDMILDEVTFDLSEKAVQEYPSFSKPTHEYCVQMAKKSMHQLNHGCINEAVLEDVMHLLQSQKLPLYK